MGQRRLPRRRWEMLVQGFERSGLSQAEYAERKGVNVNTFRQWLYRLRSEADELGDEEEKAVDFIEVCGVDSWDPGGVVRLRMGGVTLEFDEPPSPQWVVELIGAAASLDSC